MANATITRSAAPAALGWRAPVVILLCGVLFAVINMPIVAQPVQRLAPATAG